MEGGGPLGRRADGKMQPHHSGPLVPCRLAGPVSGSRTAKCPLTSLGHPVPSGGPAGLRGAQQLHQGGRAISPGPKAQ